MGSFQHLFRVQSFSIAVATHFPFHTFNKASHFIEFLVYRLQGVSLTFGLFSPAFDEAINGIMRPVFTVAVLTVLAESSDPGGLST